MVLLRIPLLIQQCLSTWCYMLAPVEVGKIWIIHQCCSQFILGHNSEQQNFTKAEQFYGIQYGFFFRKCFDNELWLNKRNDQPKVVWYRMIKRQQHPKFYYLRETQICSRCSILLLLFGDSQERTFKLAIWWVLPSAVLEGRYKKIMKETICPWGTKEVESVKHVLFLLPVLSEYLLKYYFSISSSFSGCWSWYFKEASIGC